MINETKIPIPARVFNAAVGGHVAGTDDIIDDAFNREQSEINQEVVGEDATSIKNRLNSIEAVFETSGGSAEITSNPSDIIVGGGKIPTANAVRGAITTANGYFVCDSLGTSYMKNITAPGYIVSTGGSIKIKMTNANTAETSAQNIVTLQINNFEAKPLYYDGEPVSATNTWDDGETVDVYYDGTSYYANNTSGGGKFKTGEKVKEVGIDAEPTVGSRNLVESGGVADDIASITGVIQNYEPKKGISTEGVIQSSGWNSYGLSEAIPISGGDTLVWRFGSGQYNRLVLYDDNGGHNSPYGKTSGSSRTINVPSDTTYTKVYFSFQLTEVDNVYLTINGVKWKPITGVEGQISHDIKANSVCFSFAQELESAQQQQARENISAASVSDLQDVSDSIATSIADNTSVIYKDRYLLSRLLPYIEESENKFYYIHEGYGTIGTDGSISSSETWRYSIYWPVKPNTLYSKTGLSTARIALYNADKTFTRRTDSNSFTTRKDEVYIRLNTNIAASTIRKYFMLIEGTEIPEEFVACSTKVKQEILPDDLSVKYEAQVLTSEEKGIARNNIDAASTNDLQTLSNGVSEINDNLESVIEIQEASTNIADRSTRLNHTQLQEDGSIGTLSATTYRSTIEEYLPVKPSTRYRSAGLYVLCEYDANKAKTYYKSSGLTDFTTGSNTYYIRFSYNNVNANIVQINEGAELLPYEPYYAGEVIPAESFIDKVAEGITEEDSPYYHGPFAISKSQFVEFYKGLQDTYSGLGLNRNTVYSTVISLFDNLVAAAPEYVSKKALGTASGTDANDQPYTIYEYVFKPKHQTSSLSDNKVPVILLDGCIHGFEKCSTYGLYLFAKDLVENWDKNEALKNVRCHAEIHIIPVVNPYGFDNNTYKNANGVNINRNFYGTDWVSGDDPSSSDYNGLEPFDQPESAIVRDWILDNDERILFYANCHTNGQYNATGYPEMNACMSSTDRNDDYFNKIYNCFVRHIDEQTLLWPSMYENITPSASSMCGKIQASPTEGNAGGYAASWAEDYVNVVAMTLEGFNGLYENSQTEVVSRFSADALKINSENIGNMVIQMLYEFAEN